MSRKRSRSMVVRGVGRGVGRGAGRGGGVW